MAHENSPSSVMYADFRAYGLSNRDAADILLRTEQKFGASTLGERIAGRSRLSRVAVHVAPGDLTPNMFRDFSQSSQRITARLVEELARKGNASPAYTLIDHYQNQAADDMSAALGTYGIDANLYRNALTHVMQMDLDNEKDRALLSIMPFVIVGCTGDPVRAAHETEEFAANRIGAAFRTSVADEDDTTTMAETGDAPMRLGMVRVIDGKISASSPFHLLVPSEEGIEIGSLASTAGAIADVGEGVSRHHARVFERNGHWYIVGLSSTNGTSIKGEDGEVRVVEPPKGKRPRDYRPEPVEIFPGDTVRLGHHTKFRVLPIA